VTFMNFPEDTLEQKAGSVGRIMPHTEVSPRRMPSEPTSHRVRTVRTFHQTSKQLTQIQKAPVLGACWTWPGSVG
jgi:hypothetical protein